MEFTPARITVEELAGDQLVHPVMTAGQAELIHQALIAFLNTPPGQLSEDPVEEGQVKEKVSELVYFYDSIVAHPDQFPLRSVEDTKRLARLHKSALKGPAQPKSLRNKRKRRQAARMSTAKRLRKGRKAAVAEHNRKLAEHEAEQERLAKEAAEERQEFIDRFEDIAKKPTMSNEDFQKVLRLFGLDDAADKAKELSAGESFATAILGEEDTHVQQVS